MEMNSLNKGNPWFAVSIGLICFIVGVGGTLMVTNGQVSLGGQQAKVVADDPAPAPTPSPPPPVANLDAMPELSDEDYFKGDPNAKVTIVEYTDFECPFCQRNHGTMEQLLADYDGKVNWVIRHFPLSFHPNAQKASEATECAGELGGGDAFFTMGDQIFEKGADNTQLASYAKAIGLDEAKFTECLDSDKYAQKVKDQMDGGAAAGVRGTPGNIIINNDKGEAELVSGAQPIGNFKEVIDGMF